MRGRDLFVTLVGLVIGFALLGAGLFFLIPALHLMITPYLSLVGFIMMGVGFLLLVVLFALSRRRYILIKMGGTSVHPEVMNEYIQQKLKELFPGKEVHSEVHLRRRGRVEILAKIPYVSNEIERESKFKEIEQELTKTLVKEAGYEREFIFNVSFSK